MSSFILEDPEGMQFLKKFNISPPTPASPIRYNLEHSCRHNIGGSSARHGRQEPMVVGQEERGLGERYVLLERAGDSASQVSGLLVLGGSGSGNKITLKCLAMQHEDRYLRFQSHKMYNDLCKYLPTLGRSPVSATRIFINPFTKQIILNLPLYSQRQLTLLDTLPCISGKTKIGTLYNLMIRPPLAELVSFIRSYSQAEPAVPHSNSRIKSITHSITRFKHMLNITSNISNEFEVASQEEANKRNLVYLASVSDTAANMVQLQSGLLKSRQLWVPPSIYNASTPKDEQDLQLSYEETKWISTAIVWGNERTRSKMKQPHDNSAAILNHVYVKQPTKMSSWQMNKISQGGFATIYATELFFWFVYSSEGNEYMAISKEDCRCQKSLVHRLVAIKQEAEGCSRNKHQLRILQMIKNGHPHFLPKYYIPVNDNHPFPNCLLLDYLPFRNLGDFIHHNTTSTLQTKLFLMFHTVQAVRHLREYNIVHLDLKPSNVMLYCNLLVKLIDFGESYHPEVKYTNHHPGFSIPYSPPQIFTQQHFTTDSDVFSLGVIFYQLIYGRYPFHYSRRTTLFEQSLPSYLSTSYLAPEQAESHGNAFILRVLNQILSRCLSSNPMDRPDLDWVAAILRQSIELTYA